MSDEDETIGGGAIVDPVVVEVTSQLAAPAEVVWRHATSMAAINEELAPIRMSYPPTLTRLPDDLASLDGGGVGQFLFTSTLRLGPLPFDRHRLRLVALEPGRSFQEDSVTLLNRRWRHRRTITPTPEGCLVTDRLEVEPRLPGARALTRALVGRIFARRHRVLEARFGGG